MFGTENQSSGEPDENENQEEKNEQSTDEPPDADDDVELLELAGELELRNMDQELAEFREQWKEEITGDKTRNDDEEDVKPEIELEVSINSNGPIATKVFCFSRPLKCLRSLYGKQCGPRSAAPIGAVCSGSTLFAS